jgi:hypothetical protein
MSSKEKFIKSFIKFIAISVIFYLSIFYLAPFVAFLTSRIFQINTDKPVANVVLTPTLLNFQNKTNKDKITLEGATSGQVEVELFLNENSKAKVTSEQNGRFKFENIEILKGNNKLTLKAVDSKGISSELSRVFEIEFDDKKPEIKEINLKQGEEVKNLNKNIKIIGETNEPCEILVNGKKVFIVNENKFEYLLGVEEGNVKIEITLKDKAGNEEKIIYNVTYKRS